MRRSSKALAVVALSFATLAFQTANVQASEAKWFVLRQDTASNCWTAKLIRIGGAVATGSALIAGGPYDTEAEALSRMSDFVANGTCRSA